MCHADLFSLIRFCAIPAVCLVLGCPQPPGPDGGGSDECVNPPVECPEGLFCNPDTGECVSSCVEDVDCDDGENGAPDQDGFPPADPDPCEQVGSFCESALIGPYVVFSTQDDEAISTVVRTQNEDLIYLDWIPAGTFVNLYVTFPGQATSWPLELEVGAPSLERANITSAVLVILGIASPWGENILAKVFQVGQPGNHAGCDVIDDYYDFSCDEELNVGACCDEHDVCIHSSCEAPYGDLVECLGPLFSDECNDCASEHCPKPEDWSEDFCPECRSDCLPCSDECAVCHFRVIECMLEDKPGPSKCCDNGDCGKLQQCIKDGEVITDPCECDKPVDPCCGNGDCESGETSSNCPADCDGGTAIAIVGIDATGLHLSLSSEEPGDDGGTVIIESGNEVNTGDGSDGVLVFSKREDIALSSGTYHFSEVLTSPGGIGDILCEGTVTIHCQGDFHLIGSIILQGGDSDSLRIYAGGSISVGSIRGDTFDVERNGFVEQESRSFGLIELHTELAGDIEVNSIFAHGGSGEGAISGQQPPVDGSSGGDGGRVVISATNGNIYLGVIEAYGGTGASGGYNYSGLSVPALGMPGKNAGNGGQGGVVELRGMEILRHRYFPESMNIVIDCRGANGGSGDVAVCGSRNDEWNCAAGGDGGDGGDGGTVEIHGMAPLSELSIEVEAGEGGSGGWGEPPGVMGIDGQEGTVIGGA